MSGTMNLLIGLAMGLSLLALASSRLPSVIRAAAMQGMVLGILPVVGIPLPFFSYGGSAMLSLMAAISLIPCSSTCAPISSRALR